MPHAIIRGANGRRHEVDFGDAPVRVQIYASEETVEIFIEADFETLPEERRRFAILNIPRHLFSEATAATARLLRTSSCILGATSDVGTVGSFLARSFLSRPGGGTAAHLTGHKRSEVQEGRTHRQDHASARADRDGRERFCPHPETAPALAAEQRDREFADSPLEEAGFGPSVPLRVRE
jgi:hypothetical protein